MRRHGQRAVVAIAALLGATATAAAPPLRVAAGEANGTPFVIQDRVGRLHSGLARDIMAALAVELQRRPQFIDLPRARVEAQLGRGEVDAACFLAPQWVAKPERLVWSPVLFTIQQVIVQRADQARPATPDGLEGSRVGTALGFVYPELQPLFADGRLHRDDARDLDGNLARLARRRIDALVDVDLSVYYRAETDGLPVEVRVDPLWAEPNPVYCAFAPHFAGEAQRLQRLLQSMVDDGRIAGWIHHYTGGRRLGRQ